MSARQLHRFLLRSALAGAQVFAWVAAFQFLYYYSGLLSSAFLGVALTYALMHTVSILLTPLAARNMRHGSVRTLEAAVLCAAAAFAMLGLLYVSTDFAFTWAMGAFAILMGAYRALYYIPYALATREEKTLPALDLVVALMPALAGILIASAWYIPQSLYFAAAALTLLSLVPTYRMRDVHEGFSWGYRETFHRLFDRAHRRVLLASMSEGVEATALLLVWPIAAWIILDGSYALLGVVLSATFLLTMVVRLLMRSFKIAPTPLIADAIHVSGWIMRYFAGGAAAVLLIDVYSHAGGESHKRGIDMMAYEHAADNHTYVDEYTALKEMGQALGRILMCGAIVALSLTNALTVVLAGSFALAALAGLIAMRASRAR